jgi:hypothetical protein
MYRAEPDPYCYPGTSILINRLGIRDQTILDAFEAEITSQRATEPLPRGRFGYRHYCGISSAMGAAAPAATGIFSRTCMPGRARSGQCEYPKTGATFATPRTSIARCVSFLPTWLSTDIYASGSADVCEKGRAFAGGAERHPSVPRRKRPDATLVSYDPRRPSRPSFEARAVGSFCGIGRNDQQLRG